MLLDGIRLLVKLLYRRPIPFFLRTGPEGAAKGLWTRRLGDNLLIFVLERQDFTALLGIDSHGDIAHCDLLAVFRLIGRLCICRHSNQRDH